MYNINKHVYMYYIIEKQRKIVYLLNNRNYMVYKTKEIIDYMFYV